MMVVGAGKAALRMAQGLIDACDAAGIERSRISGWINVPDDAVDVAGDSPRGGMPLTVHRCRPAGENLPTRAAVEGTRQIMQRVGDAGPEDLVVCLISGGGSALLTCPVDEISLEEKRQLLRWMDGVAISIQDRNRVRRELSQIKGGRLAALAGQCRMVSLIVSDIPGDPLELIASGPTVPVASDPELALELLQRFQSEHANPDGLPASITDFLKSRIRQRERELPQPQKLPNGHHELVLAGNLETAVLAALEFGKQAGYQVQSRIQTDTGENVSQTADRIVAWLRTPSAERRMLIDAGEPVVPLCENPGRGGRNQQLVLDVLSKLTETSDQDLRFCFLSAGTDGEDGNTAVAGAIIDWRMLSMRDDQRIKLGHYLANNDAYSFFARSGSLLTTGMTGTNVGDLRIVTAGGRRDVRDVRWGYRFD